MSAVVKFAIGSREIQLEELRELLTSKEMQASLEKMLATVDGELQHIRCPIHGNSPEITISVSANSGQFSILTASCCRMFEKMTTSRLEKTLHQTAYFQPGLKLLLHVEGSESPFTFDANAIHQLTIGRVAVDTDDEVDVDLAPFKAVEKGVSRKHASIIWHKGALHIVDNNSSNGTFVNDARVTTDPYKLHNGDKVRLGNLNVAIALLGFS